LSCSWKACGATALSSRRRLLLAAVRQAELPDEADKLLALFRQGVADSRRLFGQGGVLLGDLIHLIGCGVDLVEPGRLFLDARGNARNYGVDLQDFRLDPTQRIAGFGDQADALADLRRRRMNEPLDLLGRLGGALRQGAHFRRHHRKSAAGVAGAGRLDPGVEGEKVGLEGDFVDDADDLPDLAKQVSSG